MILINLLQDEQAEPYLGPSDPDSAMALCRIPEHILPTPPGTVWDTGEQPTYR